MTCSTLRHYRRCRCRTAMGSSAGTPTNIRRAGCGAFYRLGSRRDRTTPAAREAQGWCKARRLCRSKDSGFSQSFPEESKEAPQEVMRAVYPFFVLFDAFCVEPYRLRHMFECLLAYARREGRACIDRSIC